MKRTKVIYDVALQALNLRINITAKMQILIDKKYVIMKGKG